MTDQPLRLEPDERYFKREALERSERRACLADELYGEWKKARENNHHLERDLVAAKRREAIVTARLSPWCAEDGDDPDNPPGIQVLATRADERIRELENKYADAVELATEASERCKLLENGRRTAIAQAEKDHARVLELEQKLAALESKQPEPSP